VPLFIGDFMVELLLMTTPVPQEYKIVKNFGLVTGVTAVQEEWAESLLPAFSQWQEEK
jgi:hypothetical protein